MYFEAKNSKFNHYADITIDNIVCVPHCHTSYEILFAVKGKIRANIGGTDYTVSENNAVMIFPMQIHSYSSLEDSRAEISIFSKDYIADFYAETNDKAPINPIFPFNIADERVLLRSNSRYEIKSILYKYCAVITNNGLELSPKKNEDLLTKIVLFTQKNFKNDITLKKMANELGYSYNYLSSYFKAHFACGFSAYVNKLRIEESVYMLKRTDRTITDIAYSSGFTSVRRFNDVFKNEYNLSPTEYRNCK